MYTHESGPEFRAFLVEGRSGCLVEECVVGYWTVYLQPRARNYGLFAAGGGGHDEGGEDYKGEMELDRYAKQRSLVTSREIDIKCIVPGWERLCVANSQLYQNWSRIS